MVSNMEGHEELDHRMRRSDDVQGQDGKTVALTLSEKDFAQSHS